MQKSNFSITSSLFACYANVKELLSKSFARDKTEKILILYFTKKLDR